MIPLLGRTQYFFGLVVLTLNATRSAEGFVSWRATGMFFLSSNLQGENVGVSHAALLLILSTAD